MVPERRHASWRPKERRGPGVNRVLALVFAGGLLAIMIALDIVLFFLGAILFFSGSYKAIAGLGPRASRRLQGSIDPDIGEIPVRATYSPHERSAVLGSEDGALALVDSWLVFRGERTDWSVRREDVQAKIFEEELHISYPVGDGFADLRITALAPWGRGVGIRDAARLKEMHETWRKGAAIGESIYPPATAAPEVYRSRRFPWGSAWGAGLSFALIAALAAGFLFFGWPAFVAAAALCIAIFVERRGRAAHFAVLGPPRELARTLGVPPRAA